MSNNTLKMSKAKTPKKASPKPVITEKILAPYRFTPAEITVMDSDIRVQLREIDELEASKKQTMQDFKLRIDTHENLVKRLRAKCDSGEETREIEAIVLFAPKKRQKTYIHPTTKKEIRTEPMSEIEWQLPLFKPQPDGKGEVVAKKGDVDAPIKTAKEKAGKDKVIEADPVVGKTPVGAAFNQAASLTDVAKVPFDMVHAESLDYITLSKLFLKEAKRVGWNAVQIALVKDLFGQCATELQYLDVIRPHVSDPAGK